VVDSGSKGIEVFGFVDGFMSNKETFMVFSPSLASPSLPRREENRVLVG
jgi:hypothetical protein